MTDAYNVAELKDPQSKNMTEQLVCRIESDSKKKDKGGEIFSNFSTLYDKGLNHFQNNDIFLELDNYGEHCYHNIWIKSEPIPIKGINYPKDFFVYRPLWNNEDFQNLFYVYNKIQDEDLKEFWTPLVFPKGRENNLSLYSERLASMKKIKDKYSIAETFNDLHTHDPSSKGIFGKQAVLPKTWVPSMDWFDDNIKSLSFDDIFVLLPQAERNILKLWLGKIFAQVKTY